MYASGIQFESVFFLMTTFETEDVFALFYAWTQKICTSFRLVPYY